MYNLQLSWIWGADLRLQGYYISWDLSILDLVPRFDTYLVPTDTRLCRYRLILIRYQIWTEKKGWRWLLSPFLLGDNNKEVGQRQIRWPEISGFQIRRGRAMEAHHMNYEVSILTTAYSFLPWHNNYGYDGVAPYPPLSRGLRHSPILTCRDPRREEEEQ